MGFDGWRLIEDGLCDGDVNMATDHAILQACHEGVAPPTLRFYGWKSPTLTVGYSQSVDRDVDRTRCRDLGVPLVRRPTGGRAILHHMELTYCVVAPVCHPRFPSNLRGTFSVIAEVLLLCLQNLGVHDGVISRKSLLRSESRSPACFSLLNHCEISVHDRKLIGSAQRRTRNAFLQHGSVMIECDHELLNSLLLFDNPEAGRKNLQRLRESTITVNEVCGKIGFESVRLAFVNGFRRVFTEGVEAGKLTSYERELRDGFLRSVLLYPNFS